MPLPKLKDVMRSRRRLLASELRCERGASYLCCTEKGVGDICYAYPTHNEHGGLTFRWVGSSWEEGEGLTEFSLKGWSFFLDARAIVGADVRDIVEPYDDLIEELQASLDTPPSRQ